MDSSLTWSLFLLSVVFWQFVAAAAPISIKAKVGADVTLPCKTAGTKAVVQAEWSRADLTTAPVLLYKDKKVDKNQLDVYKTRTSLVNVEKGDLSLVLKKVMVKDAGKYECRVDLAGGAAGGGSGGTGGSGGSGGSGGTGGSAGSGGSGGSGGTGGVTAAPAPSGKGGSNRAVMTSDPISVVLLTVEAGGTSHGGDGLRPNAVLPVGLLALLALIAGRL